MHILKSGSLTESNGHYSQAVVHGDLVYVSGQLPIDPTSREVPAGFGAQANLVLDKLERILIDAKSDLSQVVKLTIYIADIAYWPEIDDIVAQHFRAHRPARIVVPVPELHYGCLIEADAIAAIGSVE